MATAKTERGGLLSIHICGDMNRALGQWVETGAQVLEFDTATDFDAAVAAARGKTCLLGNVDTTIMAMDSPQRVIEECRWRLERVKPHSGYILSTGCALSPGVPAENLHAMVESARQYGAY